MIDNFLENRNYSLLNNYDFYKKLKIIILKFNRTYVNNNFWKRLFLKKIKYLLFKINIISWKKTTFSAEIPGIK